MAQYKGIPTGQCTATSHQSGERCRKFAVRGTTVCNKHGAQTTTVRDAAFRNATLYDALSLGDRRHPWEILFDALHAADTLMNHVRVKLAESDDVSPAEISRFVDAFERAARMAKITLDARAQEYAARHVQVEAEGIVEVIHRALELAALPDPHHDRMRRAIATALREKGGVAEPVRPALEGTVVGPDG